MPRISGLASRNAGPTRLNKFECLLNKLLRRIGRGEDQEAGDGCGCRDWYRSS